MGGEELGRTRGETAQINEEEEGEATTPTKVKRTTTMAQTAEVKQTNQNMPLFTQSVCVCVCFLHDCNTIANRIIYNYIIRMVSRSLVTRSWVKHEHRLRDCPRVMTRNQP